MSEADTRSLSSWNCETRNLACRSAECVITSFTSRGHGGQTSSRTWSIRWLAITGVVVVSMLLLPSFSRADDPEFLDHTPNDRCVVIYIPDLLPHVIRTAESPGYQRLFSQMFARQLGESDTSTWVPYIQQSVAPYLPTEVAISLSEGAIDNFSRLIRIGLHMGLINGAAVAEEAEDFDVIQNILLEESRALNIEGLDVWVNFRSPLPAALAFGQVNQIAASMFNVDGVEVSYEGESIRFQARLNQFFDNETLQILLMEFGVITEAETENSSSLVSAVGRWQLDLSFRKVGNAVQIRLGEIAEDETMLTAESLGELWNDEPNVVMFANYQANSLLDELQKITDEWHKWESKATGKATRAIDTDDLIGDLTSAIRVFENSSMNGTARIEWNDHIEMVIHEYDVRSVAALSALPIMNYIPHTNDIIIASSTVSIADQWNAQLSRFEERMARNSLKYELKGQLIEAQATDDILTAYYGKLKRFRTLIKEDAYEVFQPPTIVLADGRGSIERLSASFTVEEETNSVVAKNLAFPRFAVVGKLRTGAKPGTLLQQIWTSFLGGLLETDSEDLITVQKTDLGLNLPTYAFTNDWQKSLPYDIQTRLEGDTILHYFTLPNELFVLSNSSELSRAIVDAGSQQTPRLEMPADAENVVGFGRMPGISMAQMFETVASLFEYIMDDSSDLQLEGNTLIFGRQRLIQNRQFYDELASLFAGVTMAFASIDNVQWLTNQDGSRRVTTGSVSFSTP